MGGDSHFAFFLLRKFFAMLSTLGIDVAVLRKILWGENILLQHEWSYRKDIEALVKHTESTLNLLSENSRIQIAGNTIKIERDVVSELLKVSATGSFVLVGEPGTGKSGVIHELASQLLSSGYDVVCLAVDKLDRSGRDSNPRYRFESCKRRRESAML